MAPANRLSLEGRHAHGAVFTRRPGIAVRRGVAGRGCRRGSFARDLNLDQIVAAIAGDREERELITRVLFAPLHDADAVRYRREVFHDLENPACPGRSSGFPGSSARYVPTCASRRRCRTATSGRAPIGSPALLAFRADSTLFLRAERQPAGRRDYKLAVKDPLPTSFGEDLYYRLGETEPCP